MADSRDGIYKKVQEPQEQEPEYVSMPGEYILQDDVPLQLYEKKERIAEIIKWLYLNDGQFDRASQWREALVKFLEEIL